MVNVSCMTVHITYKVKKLNYFSLLSFTKLFQSPHLQMMNENFNKYKKFNTLKINPLNTLK